MKVLFFVLNKIEKLDQLLHAFSEHNITGATIINSSGMMHQLLEDEDYSTFSLRHLIDGQRKDNKTIFMVIQDNQVEVVVKLIEKVVGKLENPDTGIVFTMPVDFTKGLIKCQ